MSRKDPEGIYKDIGERITWQLVLPALLLLLASLLFRSETPPQGWRAYISLLAFPLVIVLVFTLDYLERKNVSTAMDPINYEEKARKFWKLVTYTHIIGISGFVFSAIIDTWEIMGYLLIMQYWLLLNMWIRFSRKLLSIRVPKKTGKL